MLSKWQKHITLSSENIKSINTKNTKATEIVTNNLQQEDKLINLKKLKEYWGNDLEIQLKMLNLYITEASQYLKDLKSSIANENFDDIYTNAHRLKGASLSAAIHLIPNQCVEIEKLSKEFNLERINDLIINIEAHFNKVQKFSLNWNKTIP